MEDLLEDIVNVSNGNVRLVRYLADKDEESAKLARQSFVPPINFSEQSGGEFKVKVGYLGMGMTYANRQENVPFVETTDGLEYRLMANIRRMSQKRPSTISFMHGHGEWMRDADLQSFRDQLERHHLVLELDADREDGLIQGSAEPFAGTDVLVVPGSREEVPPWVRASIDEFLAEGGKVLMLVDSLEVDDRALRATKANTGLSAWLGEYGVFVQDNVVFDTRSHETLLFNTRFGGVNLPYPYWPRVLTEEQAISGGVNSVVFPWTSSVEIGEATGETIETEIKPLVVTSEFAAVDSSFRDLTPESPTLEEYTEDDLGEACPCRRGYRYSVLVLQAPVREEPRRLLPHDSGGGLDVAHGADGQWVPRARRTGSQLDRLAEPGGPACGHPVQGQGDPPAGVHLGPAPRHRAVWEYLRGIGGPDSLCDGALLPAAPDDQKGIHG